MIYFFKLSEEWIIGTLTLATVSLLAVVFVQYLSHRKTFNLSDILQNLSLGWPLMVTSLLTLIATTASRVLLGQTAGVEAVGVYAILFRATALPIVIHQILIIGFFRQLFSWEEPLLRRRSPVIIWGIGISIVLFLLLVGPFGWLLGPRFVEVFSRYPLQGKVLLFQTLLWSAIALNDLLNSRAQIAGRVARWTGPYLTVALLFVSWALLTRQGMDSATVALPLFVPLYATLMFGYYAVQCWAMYRQGSLFVRLWASTYAMFALGVGFLIFQEITA